MWLWESLSYIGLTSSWSPISLGSLLRASWEMTNASVMMPSRAHLIGSSDLPGARKPHPTHSKFAHACLVQDQYSEPFQPPASRSVPSLPGQAICPRFPSPLRTAAVWCHELLTFPAATSTFCSDEHSFLPLQGTLNAYLTLGGPSNTTEPVADSPVGLCQPLQRESAKLESPSTLWK